MAVSRALAFSSTFLISRWLYLMAPTRSACPGRGQVTTFSVAEGPGSGDMISFQFSQSLLRMRRLIGLPSVWPLRTPARKATRSCSIRMRPPRPYPFCRRARSWSICSARKGRPEGIPSRMAVRHCPWDSPAVRYRNIGDYLKGACSVLQDDGGDEHQQLGLREGDGFVLEQPAQERNTIEPGDALGIVGPVILKNSAQDGGLAVAQQNLRGGLFLINSRASCRNRRADGVLCGLDLQADGLGKGDDMRCHVQCQRSIHKSRLCSL